MKKKITKEEKLQILGLLTIAYQNFKKCNDCEKAIKKILNMSEKDDGGHIFETYMSDSSPNINDFLESIEVKVK